MHNNPLINSIRNISRFELDLTPWPEAASELYRPSDSRLSVKLVATFADRGVPRGQRDGSLLPYSRLSRPEIEVDLKLKILL
jgi:hypothetical protein